MKHTPANMLSIEGLIQYPDDTKLEHQGEAEAVASFINQAKSAIAKFKGQ